MHEEVETQVAEAAFKEEFQPTHDVFLQVRDLWDEFDRNHNKGILTRDVTAARRRARVLSIEIAKLLKDYRGLSNAIGKT